MSEMEIVLAFLAWWGLGTAAAFLARHLMELSLSLEYYGFEYEPITRKGALLCVLCGLTGLYAVLAALVFAVMCGFYKLVNHDWWRAPLRGRK